MDNTGKSYVIGKGKVYFDPFKPGTKITTGERYFGNTPEFSESQSIDKLDHIDADQGLNVKDDSITTKNDLNIAFGTDNISTENVALWFGGDLSKMTVASATAVVDADIAVLRGRHYQLGSDATTPQGTRMVKNVLVSKVVPGATPSDPPTLTPVTLTGNLDVNLERARVYVEIDAPDIADGDVLRFTYDQEAYSINTIAAEGKEVAGALRFVADNPHGANQDRFYPYVKLTANGDFALKGDTWQKMTFSAEVLKRDGATSRAYIDGTPVA
jgi:hypothetical protein